MIGIFNEEKKYISGEFEKKFGDELKVLNDLLNTYYAFLHATSGKVKDTDFPNWTIQLLLSQTLPLMENALELLASGFIRSSEIMIRVAGEAVILATYFKEFPDAEEEYRKINYREFFHKHKLEDMLKRVEKEGKVFVQNKPTKPIFWNKILFTNLYKESSRFLHNNPNLILELSIDQTAPKDTENNRMILGPQLYSDEILSMGLRRILNTLLFSLVVLGVSLKIMPDKAEKETMDKAANIIEKLNVKLPPIK